MRTEDDASAARRKRKPIAVDVPVPARDLGYQVLVGGGLLERLGAEVRRTLPDAARVALISDDNVMLLHGPTAAASLQREGLAVEHLTIPAGEASKSPSRAVELVERLVAAGLSRRDAVVALGGGVVGDVAGLAAALCMRGIPLVTCPTSLLAQVDASVGGKVGVDLPAGKNLLGAFHPPVLVVVDPRVLGTLPDRELACGLAEMLKHGALFSPEHFHAVVEAADRIFARDEDVATSLVAASLAFKAACVGRDPWEEGDAGKGRVLLNLGHTIGHALEQLSGFRLRHGEAVGLGLRAAARLSEARGACAPGLEAVFAGALARLRLPAELDEWLVDGRTGALVGALATDKKRAFGKITYIGLAAIGDPSVWSLTPAEIVALLRSRAPGG
jgi:3-dehydroquinate synthase